LRLMQKLLVVSIHLFQRKGSARQACKGSEGDRENTYMHPAITAINTGTPTPTLTPMTSLLLTLPVFPFSTPLIPVPTLPVAEAVGTKDTGLPVVELIALIPVPNAIALTAVPVVAVTKVAFDPDGTTDTRVFVTIFLDVDCREIGQFMRPVDKHCVAV
jgi:hypothetical protein